jgi:hypothetical protein
MNSTRESLMAMLRENLKLLEQMPLDSLEKHNEMAVLPAALLQISLGQWLDRHPLIVRARLKEDQEKKASRDFVSTALTGLNRKNGEPRR